jgi:hypothetical protein
VSNGIGDEFTIALCISRLGTCFVQRMVGLRLVSGASCATPDVRAYPNCDGTHPHEQRSVARVGREPWMGWKKEALAQPLHDFVDEVVIGAASTQHHW